MKILDFMASILKSFKKTMRPLIIYNYMVIKEIILGGFNFKY